MRLRLALALSLLAARSQSDIDVTLRDNRVVVRAVGAPLADILTRFAQATGAKVVYEAARPQQLVSVVIEAGSAAEAMGQLLEGQGLNYALRLDPTGQNVEMLVITGSVNPAAAPAGAARTPRSPAPPSPEEVYEVPPGEVEQPFTPDSPDLSAPPGTSAEDATNPALAAPWPGAAPGTPGGMEPSSPVAPSGSLAPEPGQPQPPAPASYPGSPPVPPEPVYPGPASYPGSPGE